MKKYLPQFFGVLSAVLPKLAAQFAIKIFATPTRIPRPQSEMDWHARSKKYFLKNGIAAFEWGNSNDPLVMLIHGWNGRGTQLASFADALVAKNFRVVALDGPGHGISSGKMTNPTHYAEFIASAQHELSNNTGAHAVIAHSFGGGCTVLAASKNLKTKSIILIASPAFYVKVVLNFTKAMGLSKKAEVEFVKIVTKLANIHPRELNIGMIGSKLNLPVLVVHDKGDNAVNYVSATAIHEAWPGSELMTTEGLGHRRILKDKAVIDRVSDFIAKVS